MKQLYDFVDYHGMLLNLILPNFSKVSEHSRIMLIKCSQTIELLQIINFYSNLGLQIHQNNGIHIPINRNGKASGEAYVQFQTMDDLNEALKRNMEKLGHRLV